MADLVFPNSKTPGCSFKSIEFPALALSDFRIMKTICNELCVFSVNSERFLHVDVTTVFACILANL